MYEVILWIIAVPVAIVTVLAGLFAIIFVAGKITNAFSKTLLHPKYGEMTYSMGLWTFHHEVGTYHEVQINLPGTRSAPDTMAEKLLAMVNENWALCEQSSREFASTFSTTRMSEAAVQAHAKFAEICLRPRIRFKLL